MDKRANRKPLRRKEIRRYRYSDVPDRKSTGFVLALNAALLVDTNFSICLGCVPFLHRRVVVHRLLEGVQGAF